MEAKINTPNQGFNPILAISIAIAAATTMVIVTFIVFLNSSAYKTVKQIQVGTSLARSIKVEGYDTTSSIKSTDIDSYSQKLHSRVDGYNSQADFNPANISDSALGL